MNHGDGYEEWNNWDKVPQPALIPWHYYNYVEKDATGSDVGILRISVREPEEGRDQFSWPNIEVSKIKLIDGKEILYDCYQSTIRRDFSWDGKLGTRLAVSIKTKNVRENLPHPNHLDGLAQADEVDVGRFGYFCSTGTVPREFQRLIIDGTKTLRETVAFSETGEELTLRVTAHDNSKKVSQYRLTHDLANEFKKVAQKELSEPAVAQPDKPPLVQPARSSRGWIDFRWR